MKCVLSALAVSALLLSGPTFGQNLFQRAKQALSGKSAEPAPAATVDTVERRLEDLFPTGQAHATRFVDLYWMERPDDRSSDYTLLFMLVSADGHLTFNNGGVGPARDGQAVTAEWGPLAKRLVETSPKQPLIAFGPAGEPVRLVVLSAVDCPACRKMEGDLERLGVRFVILPTSLTEQSAPVTEAIVCGASPATAWKAALLHGQRPTAPKTAGCTYPYFDQKVARALLRDATPRVLFADGTLMDAGYSGAVPIQQKLAALKAKNVAFQFAAPPL